MILLSRYYTARGGTTMNHAKKASICIEKPVFQNSTNHDDTILNCNLLDIINVRGELEVILEGNKENSNVINRDTPKI